MARSAPHARASRRVSEIGGPPRPPVLTSALTQGLPGCKRTAEAMSAGSGPAGHPGPGWSPENVAWDAQEIRAASAAGAEKRKRRRFTHGGCQVEGCSAPTELAYHKVSAHLGAV